MKKSYCFIAAIAFFAIAIVCCFLEGIKDSETSLFEMIFGKDGAEVMMVSVIALLLVVVAIVFCVIALLGKEKKFSQFVAGGCGIVAAIIFFLTIKIFVSANDIPSSWGKYYDLGIAPILAGVFCILGGAASIASVAFEEE